MPFAIKAADLAVSLLNGTSYVLKDHCLPCGNIYLLATAELPGRDKASPAGVSEAGFQPLDYAMFSAPPSRLFFFFLFTIRDFHLLLLESQVHCSGYLRRNPCFIMEHLRCAG